MSWYCCGCLLYELHCFPFIVPFPFVLWYLKLTFLGKIGLTWSTGLKLRSLRKFVCSAKHPGATREHFVFQLEGSGEFRLQTMQASQWWLIWGWWWFIPLHLAPKLRQPSVLAALFSVVAQLDSRLHEPQVLRLAPSCWYLFVSSLTELSGQKQPLVLAYFTGFLFQLHFWSFADAIFSCQLSDTFKKIFYII